MDVEKCLAADARILAQELAKIDFQALGDRIMASVHALENDTINPNLR
ncbi:hypothetical protein ACFXHA_43260 [Nocardia sp. NPDC059240]